MKIAIIGCGLRTPLLIHGLGHSDLRETRLVLYDTTPGRASLMASLGEAIAVDTPLQIATASELPEAIKNAFIKKYNLSDTDIMDAIYRRPFPNRFLGSFSQFIYENSNDRFIKKIVDESFVKFLDNYIRKYKNYKKYNIGITGSVAFFFKKEIEDVFKKNSLEMNIILKSPIENLVKFHINKVKA